MTDLSPAPGGTIPSASSEEVQKLRTLLSEAGELYFNVIVEEVGRLVPERDGSWSVYTKRKGIHQVVEIYRAGDVEKTTNLYVGQGSNEEPDGTFNRSSGVITVSPAFNYNNLEKVLFSYVHQEGVTDDDLDVIFLWAQQFLRIYTGNYSMAFNNGSKEWWAALQVARFSTLLTLSTGSVLQSGYNLRIEEFALETKAWGEGMIAQFLLQQYRQEVTEVLNGFGFGSKFTVATRILQFTQANPRGFSF